MPDRGVARCDGVQRCAADVLPCELRVVFRDGCMVHVGDCLLAKRALDQASQVYVEEIAHCGDGVPRDLTSTAVVDGSQRQSWPNCPEKQAGRRCFRAPLLEGLARAERQARTGQIGKKRKAARRRSDCEGLGLEEYMEAMLL